MLHRLTTSQMAKHFGCAHRTLNCWARRYNWPVIKLGRTRLFDPVEVEAHMKRIGFACVDRKPSVRTGKGVGV